MNNIFKRFKWLGILLGVLLMVAGILVIVFTFVDKSNVTTALAIIVASVCFIIGAIYIAVGITVSLNKFFDAAFVYGAFVIAIGVLLLIEKTVVSDILIYTLAICLLTIGTIYLIRAILYIVNHMPVKFIVFSFIIAAIAITFGILSLCLKGEFLTVIYVVLGAILVLVGIAQIVLTVRKPR